MDCFPLDFDAVSVAMKQWAVEDSMFAYDAQYVLQKGHFTF